MVGFGTLLDLDFEMMELKFAFVEVVAACYNQVKVVRSSSAGLSGVFRNY